jgi:tetratricopeptide (TPR) repeat protein
MNRSIANNTDKKGSSPKNAVRLSLAVAAYLSVTGCGLTTYVGFTSPASAQSEIRMQSAMTDIGAARAAFARGNYGIAIDHLESELARSPASLAALNGLGSSYDQLGRYDVAQRYYFRALDLAPQSSLTIGNIGYSYLLQGRSLEAASLLQLALHFDAENRVAAANLGFAREAPATEARGIVLKDVRSSNGIVLHQLPETVVWPEQEPDQEQELELAINPNLRIEVSNGNGINGMAAQLREFLRHQGSRVVRLSNADNFAYARSTVYYREGYRESAEALAAMFPSHGITLQQSDRLVERVDARLLIGLDFSQFEAEKITTGETLAQLTL